MIMVSHNLNMIDEYCQQGLLLKDGQQMFFGGVKEAINRYQEILT